MSDSADMKAFVLSQDRMSSEVLQRCLVVRGLAVEIVGLAKIAMGALPRDADDYVVFIDFDSESSRATAATLPAGTRVVPFGGADSRRFAKGALENLYLTKPFAQDRIDMVVDGLLLGNLRLPAERAAATADKLPAAEAFSLEAWEFLLKDIAKERQRVRQMLTATPEQLKALLVKDTVLGDDGMPRIDTENLPLRSVLIVEREMSAAQAFARYLSRKCVLQADIAHDGKAAWRMLSQQRYDAVIIDWEIEEVSALAIYNRLRMSPQYRYLPLLVTSNHMKPADFRLLDDDFAVAFVEKPVQERAFSEGLDKIVSASIVAHRFLNTLVPHVEQALAAGALTRRPNGAVDDIVLQAVRLTGDRLLDGGRIADAEHAYATAWSLGDRRLAVVTGYAKACLLGGKSKQAKSLLLTADVLGPRNVERLCLLGEADLSLQNPLAARERFDKALEIDASVEVAKAGKNVAETILSSPPDAAQGVPLGHFSSYLNAVGISLSRAGELNKALRYYRSAMVFVREPEKQAKLCFNVGICHMRGKQKKAAEEAFKMALKLSRGSLAKAQRYYDLVTGNAPAEGADAAEELIVDGGDDSELLERF